MQSDPFVGFLPLETGWGKGWKNESWGRHVSDKISGFRPDGMGHEMRPSSHPSFFYDQSRTQAFSQRE